VSFSQPKLKYFKNITIPILAMRSKDDILWPCFHYCRRPIKFKEEIESLVEVSTSWGLNISVRVFISHGVV
jgi:hypothetical protein